MMSKYILRGKEVKNASWLILGKVIQMLISFVVSVISARYLGPSNYGLVNYGLAYTTFFMAFCNLGFNSILVKEFVEKSEDVGLTIGTTIVYRIFASISSVIIIVIISFFLDRDEIYTRYVVALCSISLVFQVAEIFNYWFQSQYQSKKTAIAALVAYIITAIYKILLLVLGKNVLWFAVATSIDYLVYGIVIYGFYRRACGQKLSFSSSRGRDLLKQSYHYMISSAMVAVYMQADKFLLKQMVSENEVGFFSVASNLCSIWVFVLSAIIDSMYPSILQLYNENKMEEFDKRNKQLYAIVFYLSCLVAICFVLLGGPVIRILYGEEYAGAIDVLRILAWYTAFSYLGVARNAWLICKNAQKYLKYMYFGAGILNIVINYLLIPKYGAVGAAVASLITQIATSIVLPLLISETRENSKLMLQAILFRGLK